MPARSDAQLGILSSSMQDASVAAVLGWSVARVCREREALSNERNPKVVAYQRPPVLVESTPAPTPYAPTQKRSPRAPKATRTCHLPSQVQRWCRWFLRAGWTRREVAYLFGISVHELPSVT